MTEMKLRSLKEAYERIEALEDGASSSSVQIDFATPEEVLAAMTASDTTSTTESTGEATE